MIGYLAAGLVGVKKWNSGIYFEFIDFGKYLIKKGGKEAILISDTRPQGITYEASPLFTFQSPITTDTLTAR